MSVIQQVFNAIAPTRKGMKVPTIQSKTGLDKRQVSNGIYKLRVKGYITTPSRGTWAATAAGRKAMAGKQASTPAKAAPKKAPAPSKPEFIERIKGGGGAKPATLLANTPGTMALAALIHQQFSDTLEDLIDSITAHIGARQLAGIDTAPFEQMLQQITDAPAAPAQGKAVA